MLLSLHCTCVFECICIHSGFINGPTLLCLHVNKLHRISMIIKITNITVVRI